jgi:hypothetical protein
MMSHGLQEQETQGLEQGPSLVGTSAALKKGREMSQNLTQEQRE